MHSPEPWNRANARNTDEVVAPVFDGDYAERIIDANGRDVISIAISQPTGMGHEGDCNLVLSKEDAERIIACVNFCNGLSNDTLTRFGEGKERCPAVVWAHVMARSCAVALVNQLWPDCDGFVDGLVSLAPRRSDTCDDVQKSRPQREN